MIKFIYFILCSLCLISVSDAATVQSTATQTSAYNYNYMYPFMNNQMRTDLNPGTSTELNTNPINTVVRTSTIQPQGRRVVPRQSNKNTIARTPTNKQANPGYANSNLSNTQRRVVARSTVAQGRTMARQSNNQARSARGDATYYNQATERAANTPKSTTVSVSSSRCMADYTECMNKYCVQENTKYNRCYCSAKLSQIDSQYQPEINNLIDKIIKMRSVTTWSDAEMNEYWMSTIGKYSTENSWTNIDNALNSIDWASTESRVRGQQAFATGHEYCVQHLRECYYMASNLRDAYRSEISRDCAAYESNLQKIKQIAESVLEAYK